MSKITAQTFFDLIASITLEQAKEWEAETDKYVYVDDNILAPANIKATDIRVDLVEDRLQALLDGKE